jgi:hypothetical protein
VCLTRRFVDQNKKQFFWKLSRGMVPKQLRCQTRFAKVFPPTKWRAFRTGKWI